jgi:hypothetical protein
LTSTSKRPLLAKRSCRSTTSTQKLEREEVRSSASCTCLCVGERGGVGEISISEGNMDRGLVHKSSPLVGEMGEAGHGWWSVNNLRPPFEQQHHPSLFMPSTTATTTAAPSSSSSSPLHSLSSLLLSNHYPLPTTSTSPWQQHDTGSTTTSSLHGQQGLGQQDSWSQLVQYVIHCLPLYLPAVCV